MTELAIIWQSVDSVSSVRLCQPCLKSEEWRLTRLKSREMHQNHLLLITWILNLKNWLYYFLCNFKCILSMYCILFWTVNFILSTVSWYSVLIHQLYKHSTALYILLSSLQSSITTDDLTAEKSITVIVYVSIRVKTMFSCSDDDAFLISSLTFSHCEWSCPWQKCSNLTSVSAVCCEWELLKKFHFNFPSYKLKIWSNTTWNLVSWYTIISQIQWVCQSKSECLRKQLMYKDWTSMRTLIRRI